MEADLRRSLKKPSPMSLTKQEQTLLQAQLDKEARIRTSVSSIKAHFERGLHFIRGFVEANVLAFRSYMALIVSLLLDGALCANGSTLLRQAGFEAYLVNFHRQF
jgi:hypothetical protein